ncbi:penicillin-binding protein 1C [Aureibacter tunicatorum]|uniref:peptidoglycan glycosyltransferase n=1 Tax=Aureibacter tunicatorum TaxID=866807 RepID=A0AAE3XSE7_9BACT|nr:penicillin-binding protein 1C [Aureibacter tunicatorum]MDR6241670.1 penicillin-binding protein 1C [Aureibacter tunicatorum]BDD07344.1 penicillin-binding protein 1C [Aureibacter tunicatorum]
MMSKKRVHFFYLLFGLILLINFQIQIPDTLFNKPYSTVLQSQDGKMLGASIAQDEQWRFPETDSLSVKYEKALLLFEDEYFFYHFGINPISIARAAIDNISSGRIVSGGSTITMQLARMSCEHATRTIFQKLKEIIIAVKLECFYSKRDILNMYASRAPFGGNVVGIEAASWRYFGRSQYDLSWAENAALAVLPNAPSLIYPGRNDGELKLKRNRLLKKLLESDVIDLETYDLSVMENPPAKPRRLEQHALHLLNRAKKEGHAQKVVKTTLDFSLQLKVNELLNRHSEWMQGQQIHNAAAIVLDIDKGSVLAYVGNTDAGEKHGEQVDIITSKRSTGSLLKPFLYAMMIDEGMRSPKEIVDDVPMILNGFAPKNFSKQYDGVVPLDEALYRSLNMPFVKELKDFGYEKFHFHLKKMGMNTLTNAPSHYGLSLILGGAETTLWEISSVYASFARSLNNYFRWNDKGRYSKDDFHPNSYVDKSYDRKVSDNGLFRASSIWLTLQSLKQVKRPTELGDWQRFESSKNIYWKTGTSMGFRDAWSIGVTGKYLVGVWVGNADGEGRSGLVGVKTAAPVMLDIFSVLPKNKDFAKPVGDIVHRKVCSISGMLASVDCPKQVEQAFPKHSMYQKKCPYHKEVMLDKNMQFRVNSNCYPVHQMVSKNYFILPPVQGWYYGKKTPHYKVLPPMMLDCYLSNESVMELIYPKARAKIFIPTDMDLKKSAVIFELAHRNPKKRIFWYVDGIYMGVTSEFHQLEVNIGKGSHKLFVVDEDGNELEEIFEIINES